jgi:hypothetical protein
MNMQGSMNMDEGFFLSDGKKYRMTRFPLDALNGAKRNENESIAYFNKRFDHIVQNLQKYIKPPIETIFDLLHRCI